MLTIKFSNGLLFKEPSLNWNSLPNTPIRYMEYTIGDNRIRFMGYDSYLRLKEMISGINIRFAGQSKVILLGRRGDVCDKLTVNLITKKISREVVDFDKAYNKPIEEKLWKKGESLPKPDIYINYG